MQGACRSKIHLNRGVYLMASQKVTYQPAKSGRRRGLRCELLESRAMLAVFSPLPDAVDGAVDSLRQAVLTSAMNGEDDVIQLRPGIYSLSASDGSQFGGGPLKLGEFDTSVRIQGAGQGATIIDARRLDGRAMDILYGAVVEIQAATILGGYAADDGGIIRNAGGLALYEVELAMGRAETGGALYNVGVADLQQVAFVGNSAARGGAIHNDVGGELRADGVLVAGNSAWSGNRSAVLDFASGLGGGIFNGGEIVAVGSQFVFNRSDNAGGAVANHGVATLGESQFELNLSKIGGAVFAAGSAGTVSTSLRNVSSAADRSALSDSVFELAASGHVTQSNVTLDTHSDVLTSFVQAVVPENSTANAIQVEAALPAEAEAEVLVRSGAEGTVVGNQLLYTPAQGFSGIDVIAFRDDLGDPHLVHVYVEDQPDTPLVVDDEFSAIAWTPATITRLDGIEITVGHPSELVLNLLANDETGADIAKSMRIAEVGTPDQGGSVRLVTINDQEGLPSWLVSHCVLYRAAPDFVGDETFRYVVEDENGLRAEATVTVHVTEMPALIQYRVEARNADGELIQQVGVGHRVDLYVYATDNSGRPQGGIFNSDVSLAFDPARLQIGGDVQFSEHLPNGHGVSVRADRTEPRLQVVSLHAFGGLESPDELDVLVAKIPMDVIDAGTIQVDFRPESSTVHILRGWENGGVPFGSIEFTGTTFEAVMAQHNLAKPQDVNGDGKVTPLDALTLINALNEHGVGRIDDLPLPAGRFHDVNNDGYLSAADVLTVVNWMNQGGEAAAGEASLSGAGQAAQSANEMRTSPAALFPLDLSPVSEWANARESFAEQKSAEIPWQPHADPSVQSPHFAWQANEIRLDHVAVDQLLADGDAACEPQAVPPDSSWDWASDLTNSLLSISSI